MKILKSILFIAFILQAPFTIQAQEIFVAATSGNLEKVKELVEAEPQQVNVRDADGRTPLHWACRGVHFEVVKYLAPYVSPDGRYLFFVSQRERMNGIMWMSADIIEDLKGIALK